MDSTSGRELERMLDQWQVRLGLGLWHIDARMVPPGCLGIGEDGTPTVADIVYDRSRHAAVIRVQQAAHGEAEESLLHELIHLKLVAWQPPTKSDEEEKTVDAIAYALLGSKSPK